MRKLSTGSLPFFAAIFSLQYLAACPPFPDPEPPPPVIVDGEYSCQTACDNQAKLGCEVGKPTPGGSPCTDVCTNTLDGPEPVRWDVACLTSATDCRQCQ